MNDLQHKNRQFDIIIVGAGIAGLSSIKSIREINNEVSICLINGEDREPYKRTKLSKHIYCGFEKNQFSLIDQDWLSANNVKMVRHTVSKIDTENKLVILNDLTEFSYRTCIAAIGVESCQFDSGKNIADEIFYLRNAFQAEKLHESLKTKDKPIVIGGGVLSVELAAQIRMMGKEITLISRSEHLMHNELTENASRHLSDLLKKNDVNILTGCTVESINKENSLYNIQTNKCQIESDCLIISIGSQPNKTVLINNTTLDKIKIDEKLQTEYHGLFAAGDCTSFSGKYATHLWHASESEGLHAGKNAVKFLTGKTLESYNYKPYRLKCEIFDTFYFSMNYNKNNTALVNEEIQTDNYKFFQYKNENLNGIVLIGDKERAKEYENALWKGWSREKVKQNFY